ncbi:hypothetical protein LCGC14_3088580 [marine sediment metagenome]|uniref:Uncharacterized protein n=1 Tax=marine sediment metagenome TaxID=412755 RepID=A0A0F8WZV1_9ZZZZ
MTVQDREMFQEIRTNLTRITTLIDGNGGKGILARLDDIEKWIKQERWQLATSWALTLVAMGTLLTKLTGVW